MISGLVLPALATLGLAVPMAGGQRRLHPRVGARTLTLALAGLMVAVSAAVATVAFGYLATLPWIGQHLAWCRSFARAHDQVSPWIGVPAVGALAIMVGIAGRTYRQARRELWMPTCDADGVRVVDHDRPDAYALGGNPGQIVVSTGMLRLLDPSELDVLFAHERSHLTHRHHRYLAFARVTAATVPILGFVTRRLRLALERWADEDAAQATGGDRRLVAQTILRAALARTEYDQTPVLGLGAVGVRPRVEALLSPGPARPWSPMGILAGASGAVALVLLGSALQVHHLIGFVSHICRL